MTIPSNSAHLARGGSSTHAAQYDVQTGNFQSDTPGATIGMDLLIEQYGGEVEGTIRKMSFMRNYVNMRSVQGTNTIKNDRIGGTSLQAVQPGVRPQATPTEFGEVSVTVDTVILARSNVALLDDFQNHYDVRMELGNEHGKEIAKFFDEAFIIQAIKAAHMSAISHDPDNDGATNVDGTGAGAAGLRPSTGLSNFLGGTTVTLATAGDELDADRLQRGIEDAVQGMEEKDVDIDGGVILVRPAQYYALLRNDKLVNAEYSMGNGDYAKGWVMQSCGLPVIKTNRIPDGAVSGHPLSNVNNGNAYNLSATQGDSVAVIMLPKALLAGETIPLTSKVYYMDSELQYFIDSYLAFGVTPNRGEYAAVVKRA